MTFDDCIRSGGIVLFPADTVYGLAGDPDTVEAVERLDALQGRRPDKPAAGVLFSRALALASPPALGPDTVAAPGGRRPGPGAPVAPASPRGNNPRARPGRARRPPP